MSWIEGRSRSPVRWTGNEPPRIAFPCVRKPAIAPLRARAPRCPSAGGAQVRPIVMVRGCSAASRYAIAAPLCALDRSLRAPGRSHHGGLPSCAATSIRVVMSIGATARNRDGSRPIAGSATPLKSARRRARALDRSPSTWLPVRGPLRSSGDLRGVQSHFAVNGRRGSASFCSRRERSGCTAAGTCRQNVRASTDMALAIAHDPPLVSVAERSFAAPKGEHAASDFWGLFPTEAPRSQRS